MTSRFRNIFLIFATFVLATSSFAATSATTSKSKKKEGRVAESARAQRHMARLRHKRAVAHHTRKAVAKSAVASKPLRLPLSPLSICTRYRKMTF